MPILSVDERHKAMATSPMNYCDYDDKPIMPDWQLLPANSTMLAAVPFQRNKDEGVDRAHAILHNQLNAFVERALERGVHHHYLGVLLCLKNATEENTIKLHQMIGKFNRLEAAGESQQEFFAALVKAQHDGNQVLKRLLHHPFEELEWHVKVAKKWPQYLFAYQTVKQFDFVERKPSREILRPEQEAAAIQSAEAAADAAEAAAAAAGTVIPIPPNDELRATPNYWNPWLDPERDSRALIAERKKKEEEAAELKNGKRIRFRNAFRNYFRARRARKATKAEARDKKKPEDIELVDIKTKIETDMQKEERTFRLLTPAEVAEIYKATEERNKTQSQSKFWDGVFSITKTNKTAEAVKAREGFQNPFVGLGRNPPSPEPHHVTLPGCNTVLGTRPVAAPQPAPVSNPRPVTQGPPVTIAGRRKRRGKLTLVVTGSLRRLSRVSEANSEEHEMQVIEGKGKKPQLSAGAKATQKPVVNSTVVERPVLAAPTSEQFLVLH
ncbi:hypothetical protein Micbo1qcDRAFT_208062 [Microdochium bolleyi]|uniref:Uncharacterized protein n=1 Tax=Microdochium bolleyi TaxID=196109 RepID=A0A136IR82_9PEZI|nr:hypothetical protein Micbo1qcDRAFT_208062 [Microdochium bolleyi]